MTTSELSEFEFNTDDLSAAEAATSNPYLTDPSKGLSLITRLVAHPPPQIAQSQRVSLKRLEQLIHTDYVSLTERDNFPAEASAYQALLALEESLQDLVIFPDLANKIIVGIGGSFSAGKSRFLNTLLGVTLLPEALEPTTAIPTFLTGGKRESIVALNVFNNTVGIDAAALEAISHRFYEHYKKTLGEEVGFAHLLKLLMVHRPGFPWKNLAFLDTPGYSKADGAEQTYTDANSALSQLREADVVVWLINAKNGSIRQDDMEFLRTLGHIKPIFFVVTQSDLVGSSRIKDILVSVKKSLSDAGIQTAGLMAWAAPLSQVKGNCLAGDDFKSWLKDLNNEPKRTAKRLACLRILGGHILHNSTSLQANKEQLAALNELLLHAQSLPENRRETLNNLINDLRHDQKRLNSLVGEFSELKENMLSVITDIVGSAAIDDEIHQGHEMVFQLKTESLKHPVAVGQYMDAMVTSIKSDIKRVTLDVGEGVASIGVSFGLIREGLQIDPLTLIKGSLLRCEVRALDSKNVCLIFFKPTRGSKWHE